MRRYTISLLILTLILFTACAPTSQIDKDDAENILQSAPSADTYAGPASGSESQPPMAGGPTDPGTARSHEAQEMLRSGNVEGAISILENMSVGEPPSPDLAAQLVDAHIMYTQQIVMTRTTSPQVLNEVLYCHYSRILELDPENEEAIAGLAGVQSWYDTHGMTLPEEIDPLKFLPDLMSDTSENSGFVAGDEEPSEIH